MKSKFALFILLTFFSSSLLFGQMTILSGPAQGSYYQFVNDVIGVSQDSGVVNFVNVTTAGAADNYKRLLDPTTQDKVAMMQMDYLFFMQGLDAQGNRDKDLKVLVPLAREEIHFLTTKESGLTKLADLEKGGVVNIGSKTQGTYSTAFYISERSQLNWTSKNYHFDEGYRRLFLGDVDVFVVVASSPVKMLDVDPRGISKELVLMELNDFNGWAKYYKRDTIHASDYKWLDKDVATYGVRSVLLVNEAKLFENERILLEQMVKDVKVNHEKLKEEGHVKWNDIQLDNWDNGYWPLIEF